MAPEMGLAEGPFAELTIAGLERASDALAAAVRPLARAAMTRPDAPVIAAEMAHAAALLGFACRLGSARLESKYEGVAGRIGDIAAPARRSLTVELEELIAEYRRLWGLRSRRGGLVDSAGRLEVVRDLLRGG
jgi:hypothetical protein